MSYELCHYATGFDFKSFLRVRKVSGPFEKRAPRPVCAAEQGLIFRVLSPSLIPVFNIGNHCGFGTQHFSMQSTAKKNFQPFRGL